MNDKTKKRSIRDVDTESHIVPLADLIQYTSKVLERFTSGYREVTITRYNKPYLLVRNLSKVEIEKNELLWAFQLKMKQLQDYYPDIFRKIKPKVSLTSPQSDKQEFEHSYFIELFEKQRQLTTEKFKFEDPSFTDPQEEIKYLKSQKQSLIEEVAFLKAQQDYNERFDNFCSVFSHLTYREISQLFMDREIKRLLNEISSTLDKDENK